MRKLLTVLAAVIIVVTSAGASGSCDDDREGKKERDRRGTEVKPNKTPGPIAGDPQPHPKVTSKFKIVTFEVYVRGNSEDTGVLVEWKLGTLTDAAVVTSDSWSIKKTVERGSLVRFVANVHTKRSYYSCWLYVDNVIVDNTALRNSARACTVDYFIPIHDD